jgi:hypothetical protein
MLFSAAYSWNVLRRAGKADANLSRRMGSAKAAEGGKRIGLDSGMGRGRGMKDPLEKKTPTK